MLFPIHHMAFHRRTSMIWATSSMLERAMMSTIVKHSISWNKPKSSTSLSAAQKVLQHSFFLLLMKAILPGIGKSMFYQYTFSRLRREHADWTIITCSFSKVEREFDYGLAFHSNGNVEYLRTHPDMMELEWKLVWAGKPVISLYDGAPSQVPRCRMICFASYNRGWFKENLDMNLHSSLFMPPWSLDELQEARIALKLTVTEEQICEAFDMFGGVPRACFLLPTDDLCV